MLLQMYPPCFVLMLGKRSLSAMCEMAKSSQLRKLKLELRLFYPTVSKISNNLSASEHKIVVSGLYSTTTHFNGELQESHKKTRKAKLYFFLIYTKRVKKERNVFCIFSTHPIIFPSSPSCGMSSLYIPLAGHNKPHWETGWNLWNLYNRKGKREGEEKGKKIPHRKNGRGEKKAKNAK